MYNNSFNNTDNTNKPNQGSTRDNYSPFPSGSLNPHNPNKPQPMNSNNDQLQKSSIKDRKMEKPVGAKISAVFRNIGILLVLLILLASSLFAFIMLNPDHQISKAIVTRTPLDNFISLGENSTESTGLQTQTVKPGNIFFGLDEDELSSQQSTVRLVSQTLPSVLSIRVSATENTQFRSSADGTGFVVSSDGLVVTNRHVVSQACSAASALSITAQDAFGNAYQLELESIDPIEDIAILKIVNPGDDISPVLLGDSGDLLLGEEVVAIGNVLGQLNNTVTRGIVSGLDRTIETQLIDECTNASIIADGLIQTDAAINRGNSGGPLFDASGQLVGMNTFGTTEAQNVGFAIPAADIVYAIRSFNDNGIIVRPRLGVFTQVITPVNSEESSWLPVDYGEIIRSPQGAPAIAAGSAAEEAQLQENDIILAVNGERIEYSPTNSRPLRKLLFQYQSDQEITLTVRKRISGDGEVPSYEDENREITVTLGGISFDDFAR